MEGGVGFGLRLGLWSRLGSEADTDMESETGLSSKSLGVERCCG